MSKPVGQPSKFKEEYIHQAYIACKEGGFTDPKLAKLFDVATQTIVTWRKNHLEFGAAVRKGKDEYDCENVEKALNKRATGFRYTETTKELVDGVLIVTKKVSKKVTPDTKACEIWLCNRNPKRWRKLKHVELTGKDGESLMNAPMLTTLLKVIEEIKGVEYVDSLKQALIKDAASDTK